MSVDEGKYASNDSVKRPTSGKFRLVSKPTASPSLSSTKASEMDKSTKREPGKVKMLKRPSGIPKTGGLMQARHSIAVPPKELSQESSENLLSKKISDLSSNSSGFSIKFEETK